MIARLMPLTVGYDWEMAVLKRTGENVAERDVEALSDEVRRRLPWCDPGTDLELVEVRVGPVPAFRELLERSRRVEDALRAAIGRKGWALLRSGARPFEREPVGAHIHVGTVHDWTAAVRIQNGMARYVAPLAALLANSPVYRRRDSEYKSYRVASFAEHCSRPQEIVAPGFSQPSWGGDVCVTLAWGSTVELRVGDGVSSTRLMCEVVALVAGLMHHVAERESERPVTEEEYRTVLVNRWRAAKHGLQAVFTWEGDEVEAPAVLTAMIGVAQDGMSRLGISADDLTVVRAMVEKRQTQADFQLAVFAKERGDAHRLTRAMANIQRDPGAFETYLATAGTLPAVEPGDIAGELVAGVEIDTPYPVLCWKTPLAPAQLDALLEKAVREGRLSMKRSRLGVRLYSRADLV